MRLLVHVATSLRLPGALWPPARTAGLVVQLRGTPLAVLDTSRTRPHPLPAAIRWPPVPAPAGGGRWQRLAPPCAGAGGGTGTPGAAGLAEPRAVPQPRLGAVLGATGPRPILILILARPGTMSAAKSKRIKFSEEEKFLILEEFSLRKDILIPKSGRYKNTVVRQRAWEEIAAAVNSLSPLVQRTPDEIRRKWDNMVLDARRELAVEKHPLLRQRPREKLFRNIFALLNAPGPAPPLPAAVLGARAAGGAPDPPALPGTAPHRL
ncbi:uncharacterized protein LOC142362977, partial [Opisthocomus hoazin]|uniref:uncharacterized protein LOC142362977 n=1 Tax=Opisthocomus hoazin TaxID=30419 RepID=UPI003F538C28